MAITTQQLIQSAHLYLRLSGKTKGHEEDLCYRATMHLSYMAAYQSALKAAEADGFRVRHGEKHERLWTYLQTHLKDYVSGDLGQQIRITRNSAEYDIGRTFPDPVVRRHLTQAESICNRYP